MSQRYRVEFFSRHYQELAKSYENPKQFNSFLGTMVLIYNKCKAVKVSGNSAFYHQYGLSTKTMRHKGLQVIINKNDFVYGYRHLLT